MLRKTFAFIFGIFAFIALLLFVLVLNLKISLSDPAKITAYVEDSGASGIIVGYIKDSLISTNQISLAEGRNLETVNESVNSENIKPLIDRAVRKIDLALSDPRPENLKFDLTMEMADQAVFSRDPLFSKSVDLLTNQYFLILTNLNTYLYILGGSAAFLLLLALIILKSAQDRLALLARLLIMLGISLASFYILLAYFVPIYIKNFFEVAKFAEDARLLNSMKKIWDFAIQKQFNIYLIEFLALFVTGVILKFFSGMFKKVKLGKMDVNI